MTTPLKVTIQRGDKKPEGPYHWKHIVELNEFNLLKKYVWAKSKNVKPSIAEFVAITGIPPTISINAVLNSPTDRAAPASEATMKKLYSIGCPRIYATLPEELALHLIKRLEMSDEQLDAEDPNYVLKDPFAGRLRRKARALEDSGDGEFPSSGEPEEGENAVPPEVTEDHSQIFSETTDEPDGGAKENPVDTEQANEPQLNELEEDESSVEPKDGSLEEPEETDEQEPTAIEEDEDTLPIADSEEMADTKFNPFLEGDEVTGEEDFEEPEGPRRSGGSIAIVIIVLLVVIAATVALIYINRTESVEESIEPTSEMAPAGRPAPYGSPDKQ